MCRIPVYTPVLKGDYRRLVCLLTKYITMTEEGIMNGCKVHKDIKTKARGMLY